MQRKRTAVSLSLLFKKFIIHALEPEKRGTDIYVAMEISLSKINEGEAAGDFLGGLFIIYSRSAKKKKN